MKNLFEDYRIITVGYGASADVFCAFNVRVVEVIDEGIARGGSTLTCDVTATE
ncbi:MAG: hypothetical protein JNK05_39255 [Myxococcales bacterium]|nr:hypothetical protein [Myxococcales bacterium]